MKKKEIDEKMKKEKREKWKINAELCSGEHCLTLQFFARLTSFRNNARTERKRKEEEKKERERDTEKLKVKDRYKSK